MNKFPLKYDLIIISDLWTSFAIAPLKNRVLRWVYASKVKKLFQMRNEGEMSISASNTMVSLYCSCFPLGACIGTFTAGVCDGFKRSSVTTFSLKVKV